MSKFRLSYFSKFIFNEIIKIVWFKIVIFCLKSNFTNILNLKDHKKYFEQKKCFTSSITLQEFSIIILPWLFKLKIL